MLDKATKEKLIKAGLSEKDIEAVLLRAKQVSDYLDMSGVSYKGMKEDQPTDPASIALSKMFGGGNQANQPDKRKSRKSFGDDPGGIVLGRIFGK